MRKFIFIVLAAILLTGTMFFSCGDGAGSEDTRPTPEAKDFTITGLSSPYDEGESVNIVITPPAGINVADITVWYEGNSYPNTTTKPGAPGSYTVTFDVAETDGWKAATGLHAGILTISDGTYFSVTYYGNGSTGGTAPIDLNKYVSGGSAYVLGPGSLERKDYTFARWATQADGGASYKAGKSITVTGNVELYAQWTSGEIVYLYFGELTSTPISLSDGDYVAREVPMEKIISSFERMEVPFASFLPDGTAYFGTDGSLHLDYGNPAIAFHTTWKDAFEDDWDDVKDKNPGINGDTELAVFDGFAYVARIGDCTTAFYQEIGTPPEVYESGPEETLGAAMLMKIDHSCIDSAELRFVFYGWAGADTKLKYTKVKNGEVVKLTKWDFDLKAGWNEIFCRRSVSYEEYISKRPDGIDYEWTIIPMSNDGGGDDHL